MYFLLLPALAEKEDNSIPEGVRQSIKSSYYKGFYDGSILNVCPMYIYGLIDSDMKIDMIELARKKLYKYANSPKQHELMMMELANEEYKKIKPCFPEIEK